ncbi:hypothetical protein BC937DRAFT_87068, partial [Endogone sp. FLAS-F59071]
MLAGVTTTYPVIFSGGFSPAFWRPVLGYTALNILSYYVDVTPFVGMLVDGKPHTISLRVVNADAWYVDANLHLWVDHDTKQTMGSLIKYEIEPNANITVVEDANFTTTVKREVTLVGWVRTLTLEIRSTVHCLIQFNNTLHITNEPYSRSWTQKIIQATTISTSTQALGSSRQKLHVQTTSDEWPFSGTCVYAGKYVSSASIDQGFSRKTLDQPDAGVVFASEVHEKQISSGPYSSPTLDTKLDYFDSTKRCYKREVIVNNTVIVSNEESEKCIEKMQ